MHYLRNRINRNKKEEVIVAMKESTDLLVKMNYTLLSKRNVITEKLKIQVTALKKKNIESYRNYNYSLF